jgi:GntR family transcriptional regulator/MocR family aminotransferase
MLSEFLLSEMTRLGAQDALPLHRQLYEALRRAMLDGKLGAGERLPSSRDLAQDLKLSRNTVVAAINQLSVEGYLESRVGSGTYVNDNVPRVNAGAAARPHARDAPAPGGSRRAARHSPAASAPPSSKSSPSRPASPTSAPSRSRSGNACKTNTGA